MEIKIEIFSTRSQACFKRKAHGHASKEKLKLKKRIMSNSTDTIGTAEQRIVTRKDESWYSDNRSMEEPQEERKACDLDVSVEALEVI